MKYAIITDANFNPSKHVSLFSLLGYHFVKIINYVPLIEPLMPNYNLTKRELNCKIKTYEASFDRYIFKEEQLTEEDLMNMAGIAGVLDCLMWEHITLTEQKEVLENPGKLLKNEGEKIYSLAIAHGLTLYN